MWAVILLGLLVGATASEQPSLWKPGYKYVYNVTATSLTALNQLADQWSGLIYNVTLVAIPKSSTEVRLWVENAIYSRIHANLSGGFDNPIPEEYLNWEPLQLSKGQFDVIYKNGEIIDMYVNCSLSEAEVNQLKGLASMFQVDINEENGRIFKKNEETVTGDCMTQYARTVIPRYLLQSEQMIELPGLLDDMSNIFIDITKERNISKCRDDRIFSFGLNQKPFNSSSAPSLALSSNSRAIVANNSYRYLLGYAETTEKTVIGPFLYNQLKGMIASNIRVVLTKHHKLLQPDQPDKLPLSMCRTGGLLYYNSGSPESSTAKVGNYGSVENREQASDEASGSSESGAVSYEASSRRYRRAVEPYIQFLPEPQRESAAYLPYDALFVGVKGQSILYDPQENVTEDVISLARDIGQALYEPSLISPKEALRKVPGLINVLQVCHYIQLIRIADQLYEEQSPENPSSQYAWIAYVMAVSQAGTWPTLRTVFYMINEDMLGGSLAASAYAYIPLAARTPTPEYVKAVFDFALNEASDKYPLNVTAVLAATELIHLTQVSNVSRSRYPVETFANLLGEYQNVYVQQLKVKLDQSLDEGYSPNIQLYIRALGNIGHKDVLKVFKSVSAERTLSTFQRFMMTMSLDKLAEAYPQDAQEYFLQVFQNTGESHEIRCASALLLMATKPPPSVLQKLAQVTNSEQNNQVKAAVKSIIQSAVNLLRPEDSELAQAAQSAIYMLTTEEYGTDRSFGDISSSVVEDLGLAYKQFTALIGSVDSYVHSAVSLKLQKFHGPLMSHHSEVTSMVSSVRQLVHVLLNQTNEYQQTISYKDPAAKLNIQRNISEPLEGNILLDVLASKSFVAFDNTTMKLLREFILNELPHWQDGKSYNKTILANTASASIGFPTILGLPANVKFEAPVLISIQVNVSLEVQPEIEEVLHNPKENLEYINITTEIKASYASQMNSKINIIFPLELKVFESSLEENFELYLPVQLKTSYEQQQNRKFLQVQLLDPEQKYHLLRASRLPTTAVRPPMPYTNVQEDRRIVHVRPLKQAQYVFGKQTTGMVFVAEYKSEGKFNDRKTLADRAKKFDAISAAIFPWASEETYYYNHTLYYSPKSSAKYVTIQIREGIVKNVETVAVRESRTDEQSLESDDEEEPRRYTGKQKLHPKFRHRRAASPNELEYFENLKDSESTTTYFFESKVAFLPRGGEYRLSLNRSHNSIKTFTLIESQYWAKSVQGHVQQGSLTSMGFYPLLPEMNYRQAIKTSPNSTIGFFFMTKDEAGNELSRIYVGIKAGRSQRLRHQIDKSGVAKQCLQQMHKGNNVLYACRNVTEQSRLLDHFLVNGTFNNLSPEFINATYRAYSAVRYLLYPFISQKISLSHVRPPKSGKLNGYLWFSPQLDSFNASLKVPSLSVNLTDVRGWPVSKVSLALQHPLRHVAEKTSIGYKHRYVPLTCSLDKHNMTTFDNLTIPLDLPRCWTLVLSLVPKPLYNEKWGYTNVSVLAMQAQSGSRQYLIQVGSHVILQESPKYIVVNNTKYILKEDKTTYSVVNGLEFEGALLPGGSSWLSLPQNGLTLHFDGERALLMANWTYKGAARGLCGTYDGETVTDLTVPRNCILKNATSFVAQYIIPDTCQVESARNLRSEVNSAACYPFEIFPAFELYNSTSGQYSQYGASARSADSDESAASDEASASDEAPSPRKFQRNLRPVKIVKTLERGDKLAFSIEKVPVCPPPLVPDQVEWRKIPYHQINKSPAGHHWFQKVQNAPQNFDFSQKSKNAEYRTKFHLSCKQPY